MDFGSVVLGHRFSSMLESLFANVSAAAAEGILGNGATPGEEFHSSAKYGKSAP